MINHFEKYQLVYGAIIGLGISIFLFQFRKKPQNTIIIEYVNHDYCK